MSSSIEDKESATMMEIKAGTEEARRVLNAAAEGSIDILKRESDDVFVIARFSGRK